MLKVDGKDPIQAAIEEAGGSDAETWLALQIDHDLHYGRAAFKSSKVKRLAA